MSTQDTEGRWYYETTSKSIKLDLSIPHAAMLEEAKQLRDKFIPYRTGESDYDHKGWHSLPLHALDDNRPECWTGFPEYKTGREASPYYKWTSHAEYCPVTVNWLKTVFPSSHYGRVRFMLVEAGGYIAPHNDQEESVVEPVNIALSNHADCVWKWGDGEILNFAPGDIRVMNISYTHSVENNSSEDRYHIIIHHHDSTEEWMNLMEKTLEESNETFKRIYSSILM
jgi:hypothetical protein